MTIDGFLAKDADEALEETTQQMHDAWKGIVDEFKARGRKLPDAELVDATRIGFELGWMGASTHWLGEINELAEDILSKMNSL